MVRNGFLILAAALGLSYAGQAEAQSSRQRLANPPSQMFATDYLVRQDLDDETEAPSVMDEFGHEAPVTSGDACGCQDCDTCRRCRPALVCREDDPWRLFGCYNQSNCYGFSVTGWVNAGVTARDDAAASGYNGVVTFNDRDEGMLNQFYVVAERALQNDGCGWDIGGRVDLLYGTDSRFTEARGLETFNDGSPRWNGYPHYGLAMPQLYLEVGYNDLSVKLGHFYTIIGYESVMAPENFFYSHAYTMQYGEPFTHTGLLATWKANECWTVSGGFDRGWDNWEGDANDQINFLGGVTWNNGDGLSVAFSGTLGNEPTNAGGFDDRNLYSLVVSKQFNDRLTYVIQHDNGFQLNGVAPGQNAEWYGINQYLFYKLNCCWTAGLRMEWFRDDDGARVAPVGSRIGGVLDNPASAGGFIGNFYNLTLGMNWSPNANLIVRPELRFDWFDPEAGSNLPFGDGTSRDQVTAAVDAIIRF